MKSKWNNKEEKSAKRLVKEIKPMLRLNDNGNVSQRPYFELISDTLFGYVQQKSTLSTRETFDIFQESIKESFKENEIENTDRILSIFDQMIHDQSKIISTYKILFSINTRIKIPPKNINEVRLVFYDNPPRNLKNKIDYEFIQGDGCKGFVLAFVKAPSRDAAIEKAIESVDALRAIWQLLFKKQFNLLAQDQESKYWSRSLIRLGKDHFVFDDSSDINTNEQITLKHYTNLESPVIDDMSSFNKNTNLYLRKINSSPYRDFLLNTLINYISAIDALDLESRFLKLSSTLEILLKANDTKEIARKLSFIYEENELEKMIVNNLRDSRNKLSHLGFLPPNTEIKCFKISLYVEDMLKFFIANPIKAKSIQQMLDFLSSPQDLGVIESQLTRLKLVQKYLES